MTISDINRTAVLRAVEEFDQLGRNAFLKKYSFGRSRAYFLRYGDKLYDSKAVIGVAHKYSGDDRAPLMATQFSGGETTVAKALRDLGFDLQVALTPLDTGAGDGGPPEGFAYWWVNNKQTHIHEIAGNYLWSPTERGDGGRKKKLNRTSKNFVCLHACLIAS